MKPRSASTNTTIRMIQRMLMSLPSFCRGPGTGSKRSASRAGYDRRATGGDARPLTTSTTVTQMAASGVARATAAGPSTTPTTDAETSTTSGGRPTAPPKTRGLIR